MFKYTKEKRRVKVFCPNCQQNIDFEIPSEVMNKDHKHFPFTFRYIHGTPTHSITLYIDKNLDIRGKEFGDSISLSNDIIEKMFVERNLSNKSDPGAILQSIFNTFTTVIDARVPESAKIHYDIGLKLGKNFEGFFVSNELNDLVYELQKFWKRNGFGRIEELDFKPGEIKFNVYNCFECSHIPDMGRTVCKLDEGFLSTLFSNRLNSQFEASELECYATGEDHCRFSVKEVGRQF